MGPNDAELVRVFTKNPGDGFADITFRAGLGDIEIAVECEFGNANPGINSRLIVTVLDVSRSVVLTSFPPLTFSSAPGNRRDTLTIPSALTKGNADHVWQVIAVLAMNTPSATVDVDASIVTSPYFLITE